MDWMNECRVSSLRVDVMLLLLIDMNAVMLKTYDYTNIGEKEEKERLSN